MSAQKRVLVTGAGGFIGHHLVRRLKADGCWVRGADIKSPEYEASPADEFELLDLREFDKCLLATRGGIDEVYNLAADMGGIGYITAYHAAISRNNILINANMLEAARKNQRQALPVFLVRVRLRAEQAEGCQRRTAARRGRLSGRSRAWIWLGEALRRGALPLLP